MKMKKIIILIMVMLTMICIKSKCYAKYVFECTKIAVEIKIYN